MTASEVEWGTALTAASDCRARWRALAAFGIVWRLASAALLGPAYAAVLRLAVAGSGEPVLTDTDLLYFATSPIGVVGLVAIVAVGVAIVALEMTAYLAILSQPVGQTSVATALGFSVPYALQVLRVATRFVLHTLAWVAPAGILAAVTYVTLLSQFDINFYLTERPPAFWAAAAIALALAGYLFFVAVRMATQWFVALPVAIFERASPAESYAVSRQRCAEHRKVIVGWLVAWAVASLVVSTIATAAVSGVGWLVGPLWPSSLTAVATGIGLLLFCLLTIGLVVNLISTIAFAALVRRLYLRFGGRKPSKRTNQDAALPFQRWFTKQRLVTVALLGVFAAVVIGYTALASVTIDDEVIVIGHRGAPLAAPENSLSSMRAAIDAGTDWVEIDVQETADGEVVVFHDSDFMKAAGVDLKIWDATLDGLADIDIGRRFGEAFADERVPTLAEVLTECRDKAGVVVELKYYGHDQDLERRVAEIVEQAGMVDQTMFMSLDGAQAARMKAVRPDWRVGRLLSVAVGNQRKLQADFLAINAKAATRSLIRSAHRDGRQVYVWTVNDPVAMSSLIGRGVDGLITDVPEVARRVLNERVGMPPAARLLIEIADRFRLAGEALKLVGSSNGTAEP